MKLALALIFLTIVQSGWAFEGVARLESLGKSFPSNSVKGPSLYVFTTDECGNCVVQLTYLSKLKKRIPGLSIANVSIKAKRGLAPGITSLEDPKGALFKALSIRRIPTLIMVDAQRIIQAHFEGLIEENELATLATGLVNGKTITQVALPGSPGSMAADIKGVNWSVTKTHLLVFHRAACAGCVEEIPEIMSLAKTYPTLAIWILTPDDLSLVKNQFAQAPKNLQVLKVEQFQIARDYALTGVPTHIVVSDRLIRIRNVGYAPEVLKGIISGVPNLGVCDTTGCARR
ncbi:Thioredoxin-like domain protein [Calidithermus terrae]|uniref:Thioredoxin-like domain protein n=1 Tax=Calidithermus terrae TaxID=1408545 RepID=A0A399EHY3_9DEIN|nr:hypothetical protein [Calidithermus terrae]RIH84294.1 Thioredoxin-like domain protein [Calidithermus terrae]